MEKKIITQIKKQANKLKKQHDLEGYEKYIYLINCYNENNFLKNVYQTLITEGNHVYKFYACMFLSKYNNTAVVPILIKSSLNKNNKDYRSPFILACSNYDCSHYLEIFVRMLLKEQEGNELAWAIYSVVKNMKEVDSLILKKSIIKILFDKNIDKNYDLLKIQTSHILIDKLFTKADELFFI